MKNDIIDIPFPLSIFYNQKLADGPIFKEVAPEDIPEPQRTLLCHSNDMTPTLENFFDQTAHLSLLKKHSEQGFFFRHIILSGENDIPMEVGAIKINISNFPPVAQHMINKSKVPLGTIYKIFEIQHKNKPESFYKVKSDQLINGIYHLEEPTTLYSRLNKQISPNNELFALALEILPPLNKKYNWVEYFEK